MEETKQILIAITELQTNVKNMNQKMDEIGKISSLSLETSQSVKSAHNRIDDLKIESEKRLSEQKEDYSEKLATVKENHDNMNGHITWLWRAFALAIIGFLFDFFANV